MQQDNMAAGGNNIDETWNSIERDINNSDILQDYSIALEQENAKVLLEIDIDPGGGFESGYQTTRLSSVLENNDDFKFAIHHHGFIDSIGKFFGMQDIMLGYPEFDKNVVVKTNNESLVKNLFSDEKVRDVFQGLTDFNFHTTHHHANEGDVESKFLELNIEEGILDVAKLKAIYNAFYSVLRKL